MNVVLLATGRLTVMTIETARADLGDEDLVLDVIGWAPPREPLGDSCRFVLLGPGRMPAGSASPAASPAAAPVKAPRVGFARVVAAVRRRTGRRLRSHRNRNLSRAYWSAIRSRAEVLAVIDRADAVVAMDALAVRAGWKLARRRAVDVPVVFGIAAAKRELEIAS